MNYFLSALKNYAVFSGRARRSEYWFFYLFFIIFVIAAAIIDNIIGTTFDPLPYGAIYLLFCLGTFIPSLAVGVRRLHDVGKSGWFLLISLIPLLGPIWLLVLFLTDGQKGTNEYGPNPKEIYA